MEANSLYELKLRYLQSLPNSEIVRLFLYPLFYEMGFYPLRIPPNPIESGYDLLVYNNNPLSFRDFSAILFVKDGIHGSSERGGTAHRVIINCNQLFDAVFDDPLDNTPKKISKILVITAGNITDTAKIYIQNSARQYSQRIHLIDGLSLMSLIDHHAPNLFKSQFGSFKGGIKCFKVGIPRCPKNPVENPMQVFIAMPFAGKFKDIYEHGIISALREVSSELSLNNRLMPYRADDDISNIDLLCKICLAIQESRFSVINVTGWNPNVLFEMGLAYGLSKEVVILKDVSQDIPTDLKGMEYISYENSEDVKSALKVFFINSLSI